MEYIKREDVIKILQKFIDARRCECSRTAIIEKKAFEYAKAVVNKVKTYNFDETDSRL